MNQNDIKNIPLTSIVIPTYNRKYKLVRLINSILKSSFPMNKLEIIIVDDASPDGTYEYIRKLYGHLSNLKIFRNSVNLLASGTRNVGIKHAKGKYIIFVDDDNVIALNTIANIVRAFESDIQLGLIGPIMFFYSAPKRVWCAGGILSKPWYRHHHILEGKIVNLNKLKKTDLLIPCDYLPNAFAVRKEALEKAGFFDEKNFPIAWEEIDFAFKIKKAGYKVVVVPYAWVWHDIPVKKEFHMSKRRAYYRGRSRVRFYLLYAPIRLFLFFADIIGFTYYLFKYDKKAKLTEKVRIVWWYLKGGIDGIVNRITPI